MTAPASDVVIVSWNSRDELRECLASVGAGRALDGSIVVVDNASSDGAPEMVAREFPGVRLLRTGANLGFAAACNRGLDVCSRPWVLTLNQDCVLTGGALEALEGAARAAEPSVAMLQPRLMLADEPGLVNSTGVVLRRDGTAIDRDFGATLSGAVAATEVFCATAGAALYRRAALEQVRLSVGVFDPAHFLYYEDVDLGWRLRLAGYSATYVHEPVVLHRRASTSARHGDRRLRALFRANRARTLFKNASPALIAATGPRTLAHLAIMAASGGSSALLRGATAAREVALLRTEVTALRRIRRAELERRWLGAVA